MHQSALVLALNSSITAVLHYNITGLVQLGRLSLPNVVMISSDPRCFNKRQLFSQQTNKQTNSEKKRLEEAQTLRTGCSKAKRGTAKI